MGQPEVGISLKEFLDLRSHFESPLDIIEDEDCWSIVDASGMSFVTVWKPELGMGGFPGGRIAEAIVTMLTTDTVGD